MSNKRLVVTLLMIASAASFISSAASAWGRHLSLAAASAAVGALLFAIALITRRQGR
jgi:hypothetical protein